MNDLEKHLGRLALFAQGWGVRPTWSRVLFVEDVSVTRGTPSYIPRAALVTEADYASRFSAHLDAGHAWVNLNAVGVLGDALLVIVELPSDKNDVPRDQVSVNLSGPAMLDGEAQWDASKQFKLVA